jgi:hypothetical protein
MIAARVGGQRIINKSGPLVGLCYSSMRGFSLRPIVWGVVTVCLAVAFKAVPLGLTD